MATLQINDALWEEFLTLCERSDIHDPAIFLEAWIRHILKHEKVAEGRYLPAIGAIVTRNNVEVLIVGNEYVKGDPLVWNLPGGALEPGEELYQGVRRELFEETGIEALEIGQLAWITQVYTPEKTSLLGCAFEITNWQGEVSLQNEETGGSVRQAAFVPYNEACNRLFPGSATPFRDWMLEPENVPKLYWGSPEGARLIE